MGLLFTSRQAFRGHGLWLDIAVAGVRGVCQPVQGLAMETGVGAVGRISADGPLRVCHLHFVCIESGDTPSGGGDPMWGALEVR